MKKISVEVIFTVGDKAIVLLPTNLTHGDVAGIVETLLLSLGLSSAKVIVGENELAAPLEEG